MNLLKMAWRNVWRNSRRSFITIAAMTLALWAELVYSGLMNGLLADMLADATAMDTGDVQIFSKDWLTRPSIHESVDSATLLPKLDAAGYAASERLQAGGLAASGDLSAGVALVGVDPERDKRVLDVYSAVDQGQWLDAADPKGIVVGRGLARTLSLKVGSEVVVLSQGADGSMANDLFHVRGVLQPVSATDRSMVLLPEATFRDLMVFPDGAHRIIVRLKPGEDLAKATAAITALAPEAQVKSWKELNPFVAQMLDAAKVQMSIIYFVLYIAVGILVLNAMLMAIFERIREFGVLKAIGYGPGQVFVLMVLEGLLQAVVATGIGVVLAVPVGWYLSTAGVDIGALAGTSMAGVTMPAIWHAAYSLDKVLPPLVLLFVVVFGSVLYPAAKAAWIAPVEAMHHQ